jgi:hypothetical protein
MRTQQIIFSFCFLTLVSIASFGQKKSIIGAFSTTGYYSGLTLTLKPNLTFTLKYQGHVSSDTAAGTYMVKGDTISLRYDYNNYEIIFASYKEQNKEVPIDMQLAASKVLLRPKTLIKKHSKFFVVDETTGHLKTYAKNCKTRLVHLRRAK